MHAEDLGSNEHHTALSKTAGANGASFARAGSPHRWIEVRQANGVREGIHPPSIGRFEIFHPRPDINLALSTLFATAISTAPLSFRILQEGRVVVISANRESPKLLSAPHDLHRLWPFVDKVPEQN